MTIFISSFIIISIAMLAMAVGVLISNRSIKGSCGGLNTIEGLENACESCTKPCEKRQQYMKKAEKQQDTVLKQM